MGLYNIQSIQYKESTFNVMDLCPGDCEYFEISLSGKACSYMRRYKSRRKEQLKNVDVSAELVKKLFNRIQTVLHSDTQEMITIDDTSRELLIRYSGTHEEKILASIGEDKNWLPSIIEEFRDKIGI